MYEKNKHNRVSGLEYFLFGAPYYPEHWTEQEKALDTERMKEVAFNCVRMAEFAWDMMEKKEGQYDFSFFDKEIEKLGKAGIKTMLCTPTAAPPVWLTRKHSNILRVDSDGRQMKHGSRQHACHSSKIFREYSRAITEAMAKHFKDNPYVIGWQTDNEFFCHFQRCYCESCKEAFRIFLKNKYGDIDTLNETWGNSFWALSYSSFDEIEMPYPMRPTHINPSQHLDYLLFLSDEVVSFQKEQIVLLRAENPSWWVTHNIISNEIDNVELTKDLDFTGYDLYPMFAERFRRFTWAAFSLDKARSYAGNFIIPEIQSGPGGQGEYLLETPLPGEIRAFVFQAISRGCDGVFHFRWRSCKFGAEQYWKGILDHDNRINRRFKEIAQEGGEIKRLSKDIIGTTVKVEVGVLYDTGIGNMSHEPITNGLTPPRGHGEAIHIALYKEGLSVGCVNPKDDFSSFKLIIVPSFGVITKELASRLEIYAENGGVVLITGRSGVKDENNNVIGERPPGILSKMAGVFVEEPFKINEKEENENAMVLDGEYAKEKALPKISIGYQNWIEILEATTARVIARWNNGFQKDKPALTLNSFGKGKVLYAGAYFKTEDMVDIIPVLEKEASLVKYPLLPKNELEMSIRENSQYEYIYALNTKKEAQKLPTLPDGERILTDAYEENGEEYLPAFGVVIIKKPKK